MPDTPGTDGRCVSCGFLSKFNRHYDGPPPYVYEMPPRDRESGERTQIRLDSGREIAGFPQCYVGEAKIWEEIDALRRKTGKNEFEAATEVFNENRRCPKWHPYTQGFSPQEHWEELRMQELELKRQAFEKRMADDQKAFMAKLDTGNKQVQLILGLVLGGIAVIEIIVGVLQVLYPTGWPWLQHLLGIQPPTQLPRPPLPPLTP